MSDHAVIVDRLSKRYELGVQAAHSGYWRQALRRGADRLRGRAVPDDPAGRELWALKDVSFTVAHGERIGVIGRNGAGKSTLLKILSRVVYPTHGEARLRGRLTSLLEVGTGFNENLTGRENIHLNAALHGLTRDEVEARFADIVAFSEVARFIDTPVKNYSSGMRMRLAFSVAAHLDPDILLMDEVLAVGDMAFQRKCLERVGDLTQGGRTLFFVSHSMDAVVRYCDRCIWLDQGRVRMDGPVEEVSAAYVEAVMSVNASYRQAAAALPPANPEPANPEPAEPATSPTAPETEETGSAAYDSKPNAFLVEARVINARGESRTLLRVDETAGVEIVYDVARPGLYVPGIQLICPEGMLAFVSARPAADPEEYRHAAPGRYRVRTWVPAHLLNIGAYSVTLSLFSPDVEPFKRHFKMERLLSFQTVEAEAGVLTAKGCLPRPLPGPLRPLLTWEMRRLDIEDAAPPAARAPEMSEEA